MCYRPFEYWVQQYLSRDRQSMYDDAQMAAGGCVSSKMLHEGAERDAKLRRLMAEHAELAGAALHKAVEIYDYLKMRTS